MKIIIYIASELQYYLHMLIGTELRGKEIKMKWTGQQITEAWEMVRTLDNAVDYLQTDAGQRDIAWTQELQDATEILHKLALGLRKRIMGRNR